ncbi:hypothetical protein [Salinispora arenicola]|uniref:hypothetical protein n=1 Tax=Salinispora arenicola TaxID=168697 RepID=UPI000372C6F5|nr:hypothetical protein [Salinispora arenicola]
MSWLNTLTGERVDKIYAALDQRGAAHLEYANGDREFAAFLFVADNQLRRTIGVSIFDLADYCWRDAYYDGMSPDEALKAATTEGI